MMDANLQIDNIVILDNSRQVLTDESKALLEDLEKRGARNLLAVAHCPIFTMSVDEQVWLDHFIEKNMTILSQKNSLLEFIHFLLNTKILMFII